MRKIKPIYWLILILSLAGILRLTSLGDQGILFVDEGAFYLRGSDIARVVFSNWSEKIIEPNTYDTKMLWLIVVTLIRTIFGDSVFAIQILSAFIGIGTVYMLYLLARRYYQSEQIALLGALFLSISSYHVFYSRLIMPEAISALLLLVIVFLYIKGIDQGLKFIILSGLISGMSLMVNRYRCMLFPLMILMLELYQNLTLSDTQKGKRRFAMYLVSAAGFYFFYEAFLKFLRVFHIEFASFWTTLRLSVSYHSMKPHIDLLSFWNYPYYLYRFEGAVICLLLLFSFFLLKKKPSPLFPLVFVVIQIFVSSIVDEKAARSISVVLPFISLACAVSLYHIFGYLNRWKLSLPYKAVLLILIMAICMAKSVQIWHFDSDMSKAVSFIQQHYGDTKMLSTQQGATAVYSGFRKTAKFSKKSSIQQLQDSLDQGFRVIILGPESEWLRSLNSKPAARKNNKIFYAMKDECQPIKVYDHYDPMSYRRFYMEGKRPLKKKMMMWNKVKQSDGRLLLYDLESCLEIIKDKITLKI